MDFNPSPPYVMHLDFNSCFASIEQQANPLIRNKPVVVVAYDSPWGCVLAASTDAKKMGIKTGMHLSEARLIYPKLISLTPDPNKYRFVHLKLKKILLEYTDKVIPKSIDEFVLNLKGYPCLRNKTIYEVGNDIKKRIKKEIGEYLTVSIGISVNQFLAKTASNLKKPDGLEIIDLSNFQEVFANLKLTDLCGIKEKNSVRLNKFNIFNVIEMYNANIRTLKSAFSSINGYYWYLRLHGWEVDDVDFARKSFGNSYAVPKDLSSFENTSKILSKLCFKSAFRLRKNGFYGKGVHLALLFKDYNFWHMGKKCEKQLLTQADIYREAYSLLCRCPFKNNLKNIAVSIFSVSKKSFFQLDLFSDVCKKEKLNRASDFLNQKWGDFTIIPARMMDSKEIALDRIAFGGVRELTEVNS